MPTTYHLLLTAGLRHLRHRLNGRHRPARVPPDHCLIRQPRIGDGDARALPLSRQGGACTSHPACKATLTRSIMLAMAVYASLLATGRTCQDCNGLLDVVEFTALLRALSPAARSDDAHYVRTLQAHHRSRLRTALARHTLRARERPPQLH